MALMRYLWRGLTSKVVHAKNWAMNTLLCLLLNFCQKLSGACFLVGSYPIGRASSPANCVALDTRCLPFWKGSSEILIDLAPWLPFRQLTPVKMLAFDGSKYGIRDVYGEVIDRETLNIKIAYWDEDHARYMLQNVQYLPDTHKTFSQSLGGYPATEVDLTKEWDFRIDMHFTLSDKPLIDILPYVTKARLSHKIRYWLAILVAFIANGVSAMQLSATRVNKW